MDHQYLVQFREPGTSHLQSNYWDRAGQAQDQVFAFINQGYPLVQLFLPVDAEGARRLSIEHRN